MGMKLLLAIVIGKKLSASLLSNTTPQWLQGLVLPWKVQGFRKECLVDRKILQAEVYFAPPTAIPGVLAGSIALAVPLAPIVTEVCLALVVAAPPQSPCCFSGSASSFNQHPLAGQPRSPLLITYM